MSDTGERFTELQGQYLAFIRAYTLVNGRAPAEADMQRFFGVTPPSDSAWTRCVLGGMGKGLGSRNGLNIKSSALSPKSIRGVMPPLHYCREPSSQPHCVKQYRPKAFRTAC